MCCHVQLAATNGFKRAPDAPIAAIPEEIQFLVCHPVCVGRRRGRGCPPSALESDWGQVLCAARAALPNHVQSTPDQPRTLPIRSDVFGVFHPGSAGIRVAQGPPNDRIADTSLPRKRPPGNARPAPIRSALDKGQGTSASGKPRSFMTLEHGPVPHAVGCRLFRSRGSRQFTGRIDGLILVRRRYRHPVPQMCQTNRSACAGSRLPESWWPTTCCRGGHRPRRRGPRQRTNCLGTGLAWTGSQPRSRAS